MRPAAVKALAALLAAALLLAAAVAVQRSIDRRYLSGEQSVRELLYFPSAPAVKLFAAGNELAVSDYLWLRMIQYYGTHLRGDRNYEYLYPIIDRLTDLDPRFMYPYTFGALLLIHDARDSVRSVMILDKAIANNPGRWEFHYMKGFVLYVFLKQDDGAAREFIAASKLPGAWDGALRFAGWIYKKSGKREISKGLWQELYDRSTNKNEKDVAAFYLKRIKSEEISDALQASARAFRQAHRRWPSDLGELVSAGIIAAIPAEPLGKQYVWDPDSLKVRTLGKTR
jgi:hypothetical protein